MSRLTLQGVSQSQGKESAKRLTSVLGDRVFIDTDFVIRHSFLLTNSMRTYCSYAFIVGIQWRVNSQLYEGLSPEKGHNKRTQDLATCASVLIRQ